MNFGRHCPAETAHSAGRQRPGAAHVLGLASATKQVAYDRAGLLLTQSNGASDASPSEEFGRRASAAVKHLGGPPLSAEHSPVKRPHFWREGERLQWQWR